MTKDEARARMYALLAQPLLPPGEESRRICSGQWAAEARETLQALGLDLPVPPSLGARSCRQAQQEYLDALAAPGHPVRPVESIHKVWTTDPTATLPIANQKGWLGGDAAAHLRALYEAMQISIPPDFAHAPDHLALELEFMSLLIEQGTQEQQELFRAQHLDWLNDLAADARSRGAPLFYQDLLELTAAFVSLDA
ncbi:MAG: TorD/DmsD family molecular chaperone [Bacillota bacterium]